MLEKHQLWRTSISSTLGGGEGRDIRAKVKCRKKKGAGEVVLRFRFYFLLPYSNVICNKLNLFPRVKSVLPVMAISELPILISAPESFVFFSLPCPPKEESDRMTLVGTWLLEALLSSLPLTLVSVSSYTLPSLATLTPFVSVSEDSGHISCDGRKDADGDSEDEADRHSHDPELDR